MRRYFIVLGDKTTAGGVVIQAEERMKHHGTPVAYHGAQIYCHACKTTGRICNVPPYRPMTLHGKQIALENDICICKCSPPPRLIASQNTASMSFESHELAVMGFAPDGRKLREDARNARMPFDEQIRILDERGQPIRHAPFYIKNESGREYQGVSDDDGVCPRVATVQKERLYVAVGLAALEHWS